MTVDWRTLAARASFGWISADEANTLRAIFTNEIQPHGATYFTRQKLVATDDGAEFEQWYAVNGLADAVLTKEAARVVWLQSRATLRA